MPVIGNLTDYEAAEAVRDNKLPSPTKYDDFHLFDLRITGTGAAYRDAALDKNGKEIRAEEYAFRNPDAWLSDEFLTRCAGLPVTFGHPERRGLNSDEFRDRAIGSVILPYIKGKEVWGVAKIYDADAIELMKTTHRSTSPGVTPPKGSIPTTTENGSKVKVLVEDLPRILDHLAICENGVWDQGRSPEGVRLDSIAKEQSVTEEERKKLEEERDAAIRRADAAEAKEKKREQEDKARKDAAIAAEAADEKARKDAEETERKAIEVAEQKKADRKKRHDAVRLDGESEEAWEKRKVEARKDETEEERKEREEREAKNDKGRKDGAPTEDVDANQIKELTDSQRKDAKRIEQLEAQLATLTKQPSIEDRNALAAAFHRADTTYQMLGEPPPLSLPGESAIAYRRRLADGLRKHSPSFKDQPINDAISGPAFDLIENAIYNDALAVAKNPPVNDSVGRLREIVTQQNGKTKVEFIGDSRVAWAPFMPPSHSFVKFDKRAGRRD